MRYHFVIQHFIVNFEYQKNNILTIANKMKRTRPTTYKTLDGLLRQLQWNILTAENMADKRATFADSRHYCFKVTQEIDDAFWNGIAHVIWKRPSQSQIEKLRYAKCWMLRRMMYSKYGFQYCAGQDYPSEIRSIQNYINKM